MKLIAFGELSIQLLFPLLCPVALSLRIFLLTKFADITYKYLLQSFCIFLSEILFGSINIIYKKWNKPKKDKHHESNKDSEANSFVTETFDFLEKPKKTSKVQRYLLILLLSLLDFLACNILAIVCSGENMLTKKLEAELKNSKIIFVSILSIIFISKKLYKHQILGIILAFIGVTFNIVLLIYHDFSEERLNLLIILAYPLCYLFLAIQCVLEKHMLESFRLSPYKLLFYEGVFGVIICGFSFLISYFIPCKNNDFCKLYNGKLYDIFEDLTDFWSDPRVKVFLFLFLFISGFYNLFCKLTLYYFSPNQQTVSDPMSSFFLYFYYYSLVNDAFIKSAFIQSGLPLIGYLIIIFSALIYNEIIIIYVFGLQKDCKEEVIKRAREESVDYSTTSKEPYISMNAISHE